MDWLNITVFYSREEWHVLLEKCLGPLLGESLLYLSDGRGDHIHFSIPTRPEYREQHLVVIVAILNNFLTAHPSSDKRTVYPGAHFFRNFPTNTVRYNLHKLNLEYPALIDLQYFISNDIINTLGTDIIDEDNLSTFFIYALMNVICVYYPDLSVAALKVSNLVDITHDDHENIFEENEEGLLGICDDVWDDVEARARWARVVGDAYQFEAFMPIFLRLLAIHLGIGHDSKRIYPLLVAVWKTLNNRARIIDL